MATFNDSHKEEMSGNYFDQGVHKIKIGAVIFDTTDDGKEFAEFTVVGTDSDKDERVGTARVWFTTDAAIHYSFNMIRSIFVHNAPKDKKDKARAAIDGLKDTEELEQACQHLVGKEAWYSVYENPERTYTDQDGKLRNSFDRNIYGYEPKPRTVSGNPEGVEDVDMSEDEPSEEKPKAKQPTKAKGPEDSLFGF